ncbi:ATP-binding protein, partial [Parabacteroides merdae]
TDGDGLGLPICSLIASKMNGTLSIDPEYKKGSRFILVLQV